MGFYVLGYLIILALCLTMVQNSFENEMQNTTVTKVVPYNHKEERNPILSIVHDLLKIPKQLFDEIRDSSSSTADMCMMCAASFKYILHGSSHMSRNHLKQMITFSCTFLNIGPKKICNDISELNIDTLLYIFHATSNLTEQKICSVVFQNYGCFKEYRSQWSVYIPPSDASGENIKENATNYNFHRVLHLTDIHVDFLYEPGANAVCDEPVCCQKDQTDISNANNAAGTWGDYRKCDMPYHSFTNMLEQIIKHNESIDPGFSYVYFTGDIISHRFWDTTKEKNTQEIKQIYKLFKEIFGPIPVFPVLGNHESHPVNLFSSPSVTQQNITTQWIFDLVAEEWGTWLPVETQATIRYGGYYTVAVKPGFRIIALNSNVCNILNWWLLHDDNDPFYQLQWLVTVLSEAETKNEAVHILSHFPPGEETCLQEWTRQYQKIVNRFANIIKGQFNGHTHADEFRVFYNNSDLSQPVNVAYNGGSFTTYSNLNPNYRFYNINSETFEVLDFEEWIYNMKEANANVSGTPEWYKLYSFKDAYGLQSLKPSDIGNLIYDMANNISLLQLYHRYKIREAEPLLLQGCDDQCLKDNLCSIVTTVVDDKIICNNLLSVFTTNDSDSS